MGRIIHPRMLESLGAFYPHLVTIQAATETPNEIAEMVPTWANLAGHRDLRARVSPAGGRENKQAHEVYTRATHIVALAGNYPGIKEKHRVMWNGEALDILLVEGDGQGASTRLVCEVVR